MSSDILLSADPEEPDRCRDEDVAAIGATYTTDGLAAEDRLGHFDHFQVHSEHPMRFTSPSPESFVAHARAFDLGAVNIVDLSCSPSRVVRTPRLVRQADPELVSVVVVRSGRLVVSQAGRAAFLQPGDFALYSSSQPFQINIDSDTSTARLVRAHMPISLLSKVVDDLDGRLATPLPGNRGVGALLGQFLTRVTDDSADYGVADLPRLANLTVDLLTAAVSHQDGGGAADRDSGRAALLPQILAFVRQHLDDPQLSPTSVAAAHHISVSYLHRLFQEHDTTVGAWIRRERLDRARRDLTDPQLMHVPVHRIAARWGYQDHATFTRAFTAAFGIPPRDFRYSLPRPREAVPSTRAG